MAKYASFDDIQFTPDPATMPAELGLGEIAGQGLRAGTYGGLSQVNKLAGTAMDAVSPGLGAGRHAASAEQMGVAQQAGAKLPTWQDADLGRNGLRWGVGALAASTPAIAAMGGAAALTGGAAIPAGLAMAGTAGAMESGEILQRMEQDPANAGSTPGQRLMSAVPAGLASGAAQTIVPGAVAGRVLGRVAGTGLGKAAVRGAADIPMEAAAEGAGEGIRQFALNQINPNAGYDADAIIQNAAQGAVLGGALGGIGAAGQAFHGSKDAILAAPGKAFEAAKGLVPTKAPEAATEAPAPTQTPDAMDDVAGALRKHYQGVKDKGQELLDKMADGVELADFNAPDQAKAQADADQTALQKAAQWVDELSKENLGPENTAKLKQAAANLGDKANQQIIAGLKRAQGAAQDVARAVERFVRRPGKAGEIVDVEATEVGQARPGQARIAGPKKSEDYSGARKAIGDAVAGVLGADHPALQNAEIRTQLADGLRPYIQDVAKGKVFDSFDKLDQLAALYDVAGEQTTQLLAAVHTAVSGANKDEATLFKTLNQIDAVMSGRQDLLQTLQKNLRPDLQSAVRPSELRVEAEMLAKWARAKVTDPADVEKAKFNDSQVRSALQLRYGDKADLVMKAVEASTKSEQNMIDAQRVKTPLESEGVLSEDPQNPGGREVDAEAETSRVKYYPQKGQLYLDPELDPKKDGPYGSPASQRMAKAQKENPASAVSFRKASELDPKDEMVKAKVADLMDEADQLGLTGDEAQAHVAKNLDRYGVVVAEAAKQETAISSAELKSMTLDAAKYGNSPSRIDAGDGVILDAVRVLSHMRGKLKGDYPTEFDDKSFSTHRTARMFMEGIAAVQENLGRSFDIPDSTVLIVATKDKPGLTWGDAKALTREKGKSSDGTISDQVATLTKQKADIEAEIALRAQSIVDDMKEMGVRLSKANVGDAWRKAREPDTEKLKEIDRKVFDLERANTETETENRETEDVTMKREPDPFGPTFEATGGKPEGNPIRVNADGSGREDTVMGRRKPATATKPDAWARWTAEVLKEKTLDGSLAALKDLSSDQLTDLDTYLQTLDKPPAGITPLRLNQMKIQVAKKVAGLKTLAETGSGARRVDKEPPSPKALAAKQAAFLEKARSGDPELIASLKVNDDAKGLQRAAEFLAKQGDPKVAAILETVNDRLAELVRGEGVAYGLQTKKYSLQSEAIHASLGRPGFAATHDSPIRHEGKFDWRTHAMKGEGAMVKGAGTYLSTSDSVHGYYKKQFSGKGESLNERLEDALAEARSYPGATADEIREGARESIRESMAGYDEGQRDLFHAALRYLAKMTDSQLLGLPAPTYHLSVDIEPEQLMNWNRPLSEQSEIVKAAAQKAMKDHAFGDMGNWREVGSAYHEARGRDGDIFIIKESGGKFYLHDDDGRAYGTYASVDEAKKAATDQGLVPNDTWDLDVMGEDFYRELSRLLGDGSEASSGGDRAASDYLQSLGILGHRMKASAKDGDQNPNYVIYDDSKIHTNFVHFDKTAATPGNSGPVNRQEIYDYLAKTHGNSVAVAWANILHAGEFERTATGDMIRLSIHSLNPLTTAYHESLHAFFAKLSDAKQTDIMAVLEKAGGSASVMAQLRKLLANEPAALAQLTDPEERAAYMYQFWAAGKLKIGPQATTIFQRIAQFLRQVTGIWTNDQRAEAILEYFHSGEYQANRSNPSAVHAALMQTGTNHALQQAKAFTEPLREMAMTLASAGGARLRDTGIPALRELADAMKLKTTSEGDDIGFLPAARSERSRLMNQLGIDLKGVSPEDLKEALEAMQNGTQARRADAYRAQVRVRQRLDQMLKYMQDAGVNVKALGMKDGVPYFPRSWDASYISAHQPQFLAMLDKYVQSGELKGDPKKLMAKLMVTDGAEFNIEVDKPGFQPGKERVLKFISHADAAPFMRKDLFQIMNSYVTQATRRAEWARRFGDDGSGVKALLERAVREGATPTQMDAAQKFVRAVDGTLGDTIDPTTRRLMGNMIVYQNIRLLPLAIFSSVVDPVGLAVRGGTIGEAFSGFKRGLKEVVKNFRKESANDAMTNLAEEIGTIDSSYLMHEMGASYTQGMVGDKARAINDTFFRFNLMEQWNTSMRVSATGAAMNFLVRHATKPGQHSARFLRELGLTPADIQLDAAGKLKVRELDGLTLEQSAKIKGAIVRWVDGAVLRPDAVDKAIWMSDARFALFAHLKQFVFAFHETILKRVVHEVKNGNYSPAMALAGYVPVMIAADMVKALIQGGGDEPSWRKGWTASDYVMSGIERAGLYGTGQFAVDVFQDAGRGGSGVGALSGPTIEQLVDALQVLGGSRQFGSFALKSLPANALYAEVVRGESDAPRDIE